MTKPDLWGLPVLWDGWSTALMYLIPLAIVSAVMIIALIRLEGQIKEHRLRGERETDEAWEFWNEPYPLKPSAQATAERLAARLTRTAEIEILVPEDLTTELPPKEVLALPDFRDDAVAAEVVDA